MFNIRSIGRANFASWITTLLIMSVAFTLFFVHEKWSDFKRRNNAQRSSFIEYRADVLKGDVENAMKFIGYRREELSASGGQDFSQMSPTQREEVCRGIADSLGKMKPGRSSKGNVFVFNLYGTPIYHPDIEESGAKSALKLAELSSREFKEIADASRSPVGGMVNFETSFEEDGEPSGHVVFAKRMKEPEWIVCAEISKGELAREFADNISRLKVKLFIEVVFILVAAMIVTYGAIKLSSGVSESMKREIDLLVEYCKGSASGKGRLAEDEFFFDELRFIAKSVITMVGSINSLVATVKELALKSEVGSQAKSGFLASMSRELRSPVTGVLGMAEILKDGKLDKQQQECVDAITSSGQSLAKLADDIRDFAAMEGGKMEAISKPFRLDKLLADVVDRMSARAMEKNDEIELSVDDSIPVRLLGDSGKIMQVLMGLLGNAVRFTRDGKVKLSVRKCCEMSGGDGLKVEFAISDSGPGISPEKLSEIFNFEAEDAIGARNFGGVNLGLAVGRSLADAMGGSLKAESEKGKGSEFILTVPLRKAPAEEKAKASSSDSVDADKAGAGDRGSFNGVKALVVEDDRINQRVAKAFLSRLGCVVETAGNGREAFEMASKSPYDIVFMDCEMPEMDGYSATRAIRASEAGGRHVPIIAMTANALHGDRERSLESGMDAHISKPITGEQILQALLAYLKRPAVNKGA